MDKTRFSKQRLTAAAFLFLPLFIIASVILWTFFYIEIEMKRNAVKIESFNIVTLQKNKIANNFNLIVTDLLFFANYSQLLGLLEDANANKKRLRAHAKITSHFYAPIHLTRLRYKNTEYLEIL
ncbi:MAG: hypothetical protein KJP07_17735 [Desulfatitalea sp.]|nr:hypothetical protein [Desulfatitalea sp.]